MDIATIIGLVLGMGLILTALLLGGTGLSIFVDVPSLMITVGGALSALLINFPLKNVLGVFSVVKNCFTVRLPEPTDTIQQFKRFADISRSNGMLALEEEVSGISDPFLSRGLELLVGGTSKEVLQQMMETEISCIAQRHQNGKKILDATASYAPAFGMIGTLIGLVAMLRKLDDPSKIGVGMAVALLTTFYGALLANLVCIPLAGKLENRSQQEVLLRELMVVGLLALMDGLTPRGVEERLFSFLSPSKRPTQEQHPMAA